MEEEYRGYRIVHDFGQMVRIINEGKGAIPAILRGSYTNRTFAKKSIDVYLEGKDIKDGKANSGS
jgi:hypothetical protein